MKKLIVFLCCVAILCSIGVAAFADYDLSGMTDDELSELQKAVEAEIRSRKTTQNSDAGETFEAMVYSGSGDKVLALDPIPAAHVFRISGNAGSHYFGVIAYDAQGEKLGAIVNTTEVYNGIVFEKKQAAATLEIKSGDAWEITVLPLADMETTYKGSTISGSGDSIILFSPDAGESMSALVEGNKGENYFGVIGYSDTLDKIGAFVNTTDAYNGQVMLKKNPRVFEIKSEGDWSITFE